MHPSRTFAPAAFAFSLLAVASSVLLTPATVMTVSTSTPCASGQKLRHHEDGKAYCGPLKAPEPMEELMAMERDIAAKRGVPAPGELLKLYNERAALATAAVQASVPGSAGDWKPYGKGPLISNDSRFPVVNTLGLVELAGRVDSLDYDPVNKRLFASVGTGGVWMSTNLGVLWSSVGDKLPSQIIGATAWTPAGGGTLLALGGEPSMGGFNFGGIGAFWTADLGATWTQATGVPDNIMGFKLTVDKKSPNIVYAGTSKGLYRSTDAGRSYTPVSLPVGGGCEMRDDRECQFANFVTDVAVQVPGGSTNIAPATSSAVIAAVGYRAGQKAYPDGKLHSPGNGLYKSATGAPGTFTEVTGAYAASAASPVGFMPKSRVGRVAFAAASGPAQNHNYLYAIAQDAVLFNGGSEVLDVPLVIPQLGTATAATPSTFGGLYASADFGSTWTRMADTTEISNNPSTGTALAPPSAPGQQGYYNIWIAVDPTLQATGIPTRMMFGLEEVWITRLSNVPLNGTAQSGPNDFKVVGDYFAGTSCAGVKAGTPACPTSNSPLAHTTTHPDQHVGLFVADDTGGGVTAVAGNDGGVFTQHVAAGGEFANDKWGDGANRGFNTILPYGLAVAKDHTVWFGLQDNGSGKIFSEDSAAVAPADKGKIVMAWGGDGFFAAVDPNNSNVGYSEYTLGDMRYTTNGGTTWTNSKPTLTGAMFSNYFELDPTDAKHLVTGAREIFEQTNAPTGAWIKTFDAGVNATNAQNYQMSTLDVKGAAIYAGFCGVCDILNKANLGFYNALATNVGGTLPPKKGAVDGWHFAAKRGLPNRWIAAIEIDAANPSTVYVGLGDYAVRQWASKSYYQDTNAGLGSGRLFKSTNAGDDFVDITGNLPNAPVTAIQLYTRPNSTTSQLIVGGDLGTFISGDTVGTNWAVLGKGLPVTPVGQLQMSPSDPNRLFIAAYGRGIWSYAFADPIDPPPPPTNQLPVALLRANPSTGTAPITVTFDASGSSDPDAGDAVVSYTYDFGDGSPASVDVAMSSVAHNYSKAGTYTAVLTVKDRAGAVSAQPSVVELVFDAAATAIEPFTFAERTNVPTKTFITSEAVTLVGSGASSLPISITGGGQYSINGGPFTASAGNILPGDRLVVRHVSAASENTAAVSTVTVGDYRTDFKSTTTVFDRVPDQFNFPTKSEQQAGALVSSELFTPMAYDSTATVAPGPGLAWRLEGAASFTTARGSIDPGQKIQVQHTANSSSLGYTKSYVTIGGVKDYFTTRTAK